MKAFIPIIKAAAPRLVLTILIISTLVSCSAPRHPISGHERYVSAYTEGEIALDSEVRIRLTRGIGNVTPDKKLLSFSPRLRGSYRMSPDGTLVFKPNPGAMKEGKKYIGTLRLGRIYDIDKKSLRKFRFCFIAVGQAEPSPVIVRPEYVQEHPTQAEQGSFRVVSAEMTEGDSPFITLVFTEPVGTVEEGFVEVLNATCQGIETDSTEMRVLLDAKMGLCPTVLVSEALKSKAGVRLGMDYEAGFRQSEKKPEVKLLADGVIVPDTGHMALPFKAVSLRAVDVSVFKIYRDNILMFLQREELDSRWGLNSVGQMVASKLVRLDGDSTRDLRQWQDFEVDLSGVTGQEVGAIYRVCISFRQEYSLYGIEDDELEDIEETAWTPAKDGRKYEYINEYSDWDWDEYDYDDRDDPQTPSYYMARDRFPMRNMLSSNIGIIAKSGTDDRMWVSVSDINTVAPMAGASVTAYNYQLRKVGTAYTDAEGMATLRVSEQAHILVASKNGISSYLRIDDGNRNSLSRFDTGGTSVKDGLLGYVYGERGVWRPGDTLHLTLVVRDRSGKLPDSHPATLELFTPQGQFHSSHVCAKGTNGFYVFNVPTAENDPTGAWSAVAKLGGTNFKKTIRIETVKANRLKINMSIDADTLCAGQTKGSVAANWLVGPPAAGLKMSLDMTLRDAKARFNAYDDFVFSDPLASGDKGVHNIAEGVLNDKGEWSDTLKIPQLAAAKGMMTADIVCTVQEDGGDASRRAMSIPFSPFEAYVGLRVPENDCWNSLETDSTYRFDVALLDKKGSLVSGHEMEYAVYKLKWSWWYSGSSRELASYVNRTEHECINTGMFESADSLYQIEFRVDYPSWGRYLVYVKDIDGGHASGASFYVDWPECRGRAEKSDPTALTMLSFSSDKHSYEVGQTATLYIPGSEGMALVSLENSSKVLSRKWVKMSGDGTSYSFKVTKDMAPNFYAHVTLVRPYKTLAEGSPIRLYGVLPLQVTNKASHLEPVIQMEDSVPSGKEFSVRVKEKKGRPMTYTLAIVDEGLLDLTNFRTPNPWNAFYTAKEALGVQTWDIYDYVSDAYSGQFGKMLSIGGDLGEIVDKGTNERRFNPVVAFLGPFTSDGKTRTHKVKLPMYVGSVRVMVVAGHDGAYGNAEKTVAVRSPLMLLSSLPRVLAPGEKIAMPVNVFASKDADVTVKLKVSGPVRIVGSDSQELQLGADKSGLAEFSLETTACGMAKMTVLASGGGQTAKEEMVIEVRNPSPFLTSVSREVIPAGSELSYSWQPFVSDENNSIRLDVAGFPSISFDECVEYMFAYPHQCTEQLSSRGLTMIYALGHLSSEAESHAKAEIPKLIRLLYSRQLPGGGFCYWPGQKNANEWVSTMAGQFLCQAEAKGFSVSSSVIERWKEYQRGKARSYSTSRDSWPVGLCQAYRLYAMALTDTPDLGAMNRLRGSSSISDQARWMLASAYCICGKADIGRELCEGLSVDAKDVYRHDDCFSSPLRDNAITLGTLIRLGREEDAFLLAGKIADKMSKSGASTQERAFAAMAMNECTSRGGKIAVNVIQEKTTQVQGGNALRLDSEAGSVRIENPSEHTMYGSFAVTKQAGIGEKTEPSANGIKMVIGYTGANGDEINPSSLPQGCTFTVRIEVTNDMATEDLHNMALTLPIASGWEFCDTAPAGDYQDIRDDRCCWYFDLPYHRSKTFSIRVRAAYKGEYLLPAVSCEAMYDASVYANNESNIVEVTK